MDEQLEQFRQNQLDNYLNETNISDVTADDLLNLFQEPKQNNSNHLNTSKMDYSNQDQGLTSFRPYESPSSTTSAMEHKFEHDTLTPQHFRLNSTGHLQTVHNNQEFSHHMNQSMTITRAQRI